MRLKENIVTLCVIERTAISLTHSSRAVFHCTLKCSLPLYFEIFYCANGTYFIHINRIIYENILK